MAMAARNSGGIVIAQVKQLARAGSLPARSVDVPGALVDYVLVDPDQTADLRHPVLAVLRGRAAAAARRRRRAAPARRPQGDRPPLAARVRARRRLQPRLRHQPGDRRDRVRGGDRRPARPHRRAGHLRRRPGGRQRGRRRLQLPGDDRAAVDVRLLRRRRARRGQPLVRRDRPPRQRQRPCLRGPRPRPRRVPEHQRADEEDQLRRHAHRARARARLLRRAAGDPRRGLAAEVRRRGARGVVQRPDGARARPAGPLHHRARGLRPDRRRASA